MPILKRYKDSIETEQSPLRQYNLRGEAHQTGIGFDQPFILRGTQRRNDQSPQEINNVAEAASIDGTRLAKMFVSLPGIKFASNQLILNSYSIRPEKNFFGSILAGPLAPLGAQIPRSVQLKLPSGPIDFSKFRGGSFEPAFSYQRDLPDGNIVRLYRQIDNPNRGFIVPTITNNPLSAINAAVNTSNTMLASKFWDLQNQGGLSGSNFGIGINRYDEETPYTGSMQQLPSNSDLDKISNEYAQYGLVDFRNLTSSPPNLKQSPEVAGLNEFQAPPTEYSYENYNRRRAFGHRAPRANPTRDFQEFSSEPIESINILKSGEKPVKRDTVDVKFVRTDTNKPLWFAPAITSLTDSVNFAWNSDEFLGRIDPVHYSTGVGNREIQFQMKVFAFSREEMESIYNRTQALIRYASPRVVNNTQYQGGFLRFTLGDLYVDRLCYISSISMTFPDDYDWEINVGKQSDTYVLPRMIDISVSITFVAETPSNDRQFVFGVPGQHRDTTPSILWLDWNDYS